LIARVGWNCPDTTQAGHHPRMMSEGTAAAPPRTIPSARGSRCTAPRAAARAADRLGPSPSCWELGGVCVCVSVCDGCTGSVAWGGSRGQASQALGRGGARAATAEAMGAITGALGRRDGTLVGPRRASWTTWDWAGLGGMGRSQQTAPRVWVAGAARAAEHSQRQSRTRDGQPVQGPEGDPATKRHHPAPAPASACASEPVAAAGSSSSG